MKRSIYFVILFLICCHVKSQNLEPISSFEDRTLIIEKVQSKTYTNKSEDIEELQSIIRYYMELYGKEYNLAHRPLVVTFPNNYIRLMARNDDGSTALKKIDLYDFSKVYDFQEISKRWKDKAYINIWTRMYSKEYNKWSKFKFVIQVSGHDNAEFIRSLLKEYHRVLNLPIDESV